MDTDWSLLLGRTCLESTMQTGAGWGWLGYQLAALEVSKRRRRGHLGPKSHRSEPGLGGTLLLPVWLSLLQ